MIFSKRSTLASRRVRGHSRASLVSALAIACALAASGSVLAQSTGGATVTPVDNSGVAIRTTELASPAASVNGSGGANTNANFNANGGAVRVPPAVSTTPGQVVVSGKVPDEATRAAVLTQLRGIYGAANVVDQIEVGNVATPPNWSANVQKLITTELKQVSKGQLKIDGTQIDVKGEVSNEAQRQQIASDMANALNPTYTIKNGLRVSASEQGMLDGTLANRTIEFETGSATLTPQGRAILDQMATVLARMTNKTVEIIGHTDNSGSRAGNIALSQARADAVKGYLVTKGLTPQAMATMGVGPDQPTASNDTDTGRARNRRIEFRVGK